MRTKEEEEEEEMKFANIVERAVSAGTTYRISRIRREGQAMSTTTAYISVWNGVFMKRIVDESLLEVRMGIVSYHSFCVFLSYC